MKMFSYNIVSLRKAFCLLNLFTFMTKFRVCFFFNKHTNLIITWRKTEVMLKYCSTSTMFLQVLQYQYQIFPSTVEPVRVIANFSPSNTIPVLVVDKRAPARTSVPVPVSVSQACLRYSWFKYCAETFIKCIKFVFFVKVFTSVSLYFSFINCWPIL